jgi:hypothetical protein
MPLSSTDRLDEVPWAHSFVGGILAKEVFDRIDILGRSSASLVFPENDIPQSPEIVQKRAVIIGPFGFADVFRLQAPHASELGRTDLALSPLRVLLLPYVLTPHPAGILH